MNDRKALEGKQALEKLQKDQEALVHLENVLTDSKSQVNPSTSVKNKQKVDKVQNKRGKDNKQRDQNRKKKSFLLFPNQLGNTETPESEANSNNNQLANSSLENNQIAAIVSGYFETFLNTLVSIWRILTTLL